MGLFRQMLIFPMDSVRAWGKTIVRGVEAVREGEMAGAGSRFLYYFGPYFCLCSFGVGCCWVWALAFILIYSILIRC